MENQTYEQAVEKLVNWWADQTFTGAPNNDNGDQSESGGLGFLLSNMVSLKARDKVTDEQKAKFKESLTKSLLAYEYNYVCLRTDYHPDKMLSDACISAGIDSYCVPIKTHTWISKNEGNKVTVSLGYAGKPVEI